MKTFVCTLLCLIGIAVLADSTLEARGHHYRGPRVEVGIRANTYPTRCVRYYQPVVVQAVQPVVVQQQAPVLVQPAPVYVYQTPVVYQEEVYVRPARPFFGISFSWLFR